MAEQVFLVGSVSSYREMSVLLTFSTAPDSVGVDIFKELKKISIEAKHLLGVQEVSRGTWDVTFRTEALKRQFWPAVSTTDSFKATNYASRVKIITVLRAPVETEDNAIRYMLGRYGKVLAGRYLVYKEHPTVYTGTRQYKVELDKDIPSSVHIGGRSCWIRYFGQPRTCWKCDSKDHFATDCAVKRCYNCLKPGHLAKDCKETTVCTTCLKEGHVSRKCPVSFASKVRSNEWQGGEAEVVMREEIIGTPTQKPAEKESTTTTVEDTSSLLTVDRETTTSLEDDSSQREQVDLAKLTPDARQRAWLESIPPHTKGNLESDLEMSDEERESKEGSHHSMSQEEFKAPHNKGEKRKNEREVDRDQKLRMGRMSKTADEDRETGSKKDRSRSRNRTDDQAKAKEIVRCSQVELEQKPWISCSAHKCLKKFTQWSTLLQHTMVEHKLKAPRYICEHETCELRTSSPHDWAYHTASSHPKILLGKPDGWLDTAFLIGYV